MALNKINSSYYDYLFIVPNENQTNPNAVIIEEGKIQGPMCFAYLVGCK